MALRLLPIQAVITQCVFSGAALAMVGLTGCAHHYVGYPPSSAEIADINRAANNDGVSRMALIPVTIEEAAGANGVRTVRPIVDTPLPEVRQIVTANATTLTVIDQKGATQSVHLSLVDGVATANANRAMGRDGALGALVGLGVSGVVALSIIELNGLGEDDTSPNGRPVPVTAAVTTLVVGTLVGAAIGAACGYRSPDETFQFFGPQR